MSIVAGASSTVEVNNIIEVSHQSLLVIFALKRVGNGGEVELNEVKRKMSPKDTDFMASRSAF